MEPDLEREGFLRETPPSAERTKIVGEAKADIHELTVAAISSDSLQTISDISRSARYRSHDCNREQREMIGRLERVPLREVSVHEALDFTQWLELTSMFSTMCSISRSSTSSVSRLQASSASIWLQRISLPVVAQYGNHVYPVPSDPSGESPPLRRSRRIEDNTVSSLNQTFWVLPDFCPETSANCRMPRIAHD